MGQHALRGIGILDALRIDTQGGEEQDETKRCGESANHAD